MFSFCSSSLPLEDFKKRLINLLWSVDSWVITDITEYKPFKKDLKGCVSFCDELLSTDYIFHRRMAFVLMMRYLISNLHLRYILSHVVAHGKTDEYYLQMVVAWLLQCIYLKFPDEVVGLLKSANICLAIKLKTISKLIDSRRVSDDDKTMLRGLRTALREALI